MIKNLKIYSVILTVVTLISCASHDFMMLNSLEPLSTSENNATLRFKTFADNVYPLNSEKAERKRIADLEKRLEQNGYDSKNYKIIRRHAINKRGPVYDLFYDIEI